MNIIQIKNIFGEVLFEYDKENNSIKDTVVKAIEEGVSLRFADLSGVNLKDADLTNTDLTNADLRSANLYGADLSGVNLKDADLTNTDLTNAYLRGADLTNAYLRYANLSNADLYYANLRNADLRNASLYGADLRYANLSDANLYGANLCGANLGNADLYYADLSGAKNIPYIPLVCPSEGSFIGWKKISDYKEDYEGEYIVKMLIPEDAKRSSATTNKCRCDKAKVLEITNIDNGSTVDVITNTNYRQCVYKVGEYVYPDSFDENRWDECSHGIHFFMEKEDAIFYWNY